MQAHSREYHGPINTEQVMLIRCAVVHIPSIRKMGEITTPIATIIARNTMRNVFILCFSILHSSCFSGFLPPELRNEFPEKKRQLSLFRSKFHYFLSLRKHGFPSLCKLLLPGRRALPLRSSLPARNRCTDTFRCAVGFCVLFIHMKRNVPWRILAERFCMIGRNFLSYKKSTPSGQCQKMHLYSCCFPPLA